METTRHMNILVVGASGATGRLVVNQLLERGQHVKIIVRSLERLPEYWSGNNNLTITEASVLDLTDDQLVDQVTGCDAIVSCLGHNLTFKGIYGKPRRLVRDAARRLCSAVMRTTPAKPVKFILMNTTGYRNPDLNEAISIPQRLVIGLLRLVLPPHVDNEQAANYLRTDLRQNAFIEWVAVRPDGLVDHEEVTEYELHPSPTRSAIFDAGTTSRINVAHFMAELICKNNTWTNWRGRTPVIYNVT